MTFTKSLKEDLKRRDFTINAMAYNDEVGLVDPFNGVEDIKYHKIQCVGKPEDRFAEDALRILRAVRFASQLNFVLEPNTSYVLHKMYRNLESISAERINSEFCKIAASSDFCVQMVLYSDVLSLFIPEIKDMFDFPQNNPYHIYDVWGHTIHAVEAYFCDCEEDLNPIDLITSLAVFFHDIGKPHCYQDGEDGIRHFKGHGRVGADMTDGIMKPYKNQGYTHCDCEGQKKADEGKRIKEWNEKVSKAVAVDEKDVDTMLYCEEFDKYYDTIDDFFDDYAANYMDEEVYTKPVRLWVTSVEKIHIDAADVTANACEYLHEDAYDQCDIGSLQKLLDAWCKDQYGATTYFPSFKQYVLIDWSEYNKGE